MAFLGIKAEGLHSKQVLITPINQWQKLELDILNIQRVFKKKLIFPRQITSSQSYPFTLDYRFGFLKKYSLTVYFKCKRCN